MRETWSRSGGDQYASMSSRGGRKGPGVPRSTSVNARWTDVNRRRASSSVSAANTLTAAIACGASRRPEGSKRVR